MPDKEKVIKGLEVCGTGNCIDECPYFNPDLPNCGCASKMHDDALELLKEQEAETLECEMCGHRLQKEWNWCPWCRWEIALMGHQ